MWLLYNIFFFLFALVYLPIFALKGKFGRGFAARFGSLPSDVLEAVAGRHPVWVHAVSVGEVGLAVSLVSRLREKLPSTKFLLTTTTNAGYAVAQKIKNEDDALTFFPIDFPWAVNVFLDTVEPSALILLETEIWPNLLRELSRRKVPVVVANGRISDRAFKRYLSVRFFLKRVFRKMEGISVQDERMRSRFIALGASSDQVSVNGNLKYDWEPSPLQEEAASPLKRALRSSSQQLLIAGSTHEGEEEIFFNAYTSIRKNFSQARLLIAPRHLERLSSIEKAAERAGLKPVRVSTVSFQAIMDDKRSDVWLLDQVGVLAPLYECASLVFVGGSLVPVGGHNLAEPAYYAKPVLFGPHVQNFLEMASELRTGGGAIEVADAEALRREWEKALREPESLKAMGRASRELVRKHQGATQKNVEWILSMTDSKERSLAKV